MQFIDLKAQYQAMKEDVDTAIRRVLDHGQFILGPEVYELERELATYTGRRYCITCANGTDALQLLYMAYHIGSGDAVFCTDVTFVASVEPACMLGAVPVFCDIDNQTYNLSAASLEQQIQSVIKEGKYVPKAVVAVDILGNPADYREISKICSRYGLILIEDAAQSLGAEYLGRKCGSFGDAAVTSFFPAKPLGCYGDGGAIFTDEDKMADLLRSLRIHGKGPSGKYCNVAIGLNSRLDTLQAAILLAKLKAMREYELAARQRVAERYNQEFFGMLTTPFVSPESHSAWAQYVLLAHNKEARDSIITRLTKKGIPNMVYYPIPQHELPVFQALSSYEETFEYAKWYCDCTFSIPMHPYLKSEDQDLIIQAVKEACL